MACVFFYKVRFKFRALGLCDRELFAAAIQMWKVKGNEENMDSVPFFLDRSWSLDLLRIAG